MSDAVHLAVRWALYYYVCGWATVLPVYKVYGYKAIPITQQIPEAVCSNNALIKGHPAYMANRSP